jgi:hypothetical protein
MARNPNLQSNPDIASLNILESKIPPVRPDVQHIAFLPKASTIVQPMISNATHGNPIFYPPQQLTSLIYSNPIAVGSDNHTKRPILKNSISADKLPQSNFPAGGKSTASFIPTQGPIIPSQLVVSNLPVPEITGVRTTSYSRPSLVISGDKRVPVPSRSVSLPDISAYAAQNSAEEQKRLKRLERNRASARLRRLKKKNLVSFVFKRIIIYGLMNCCIFNWPFLSKKFTRLIAMKSKLAFLKIP